MLLKDGDYTMAMNIKNIEFQENSAVVTMRDPDAISGVVRKRVSIDALIRSLGKISTSQSMIIPPNCRGIWETKSNKYFLFIIPAHMGRTAVCWFRSDTDNYGRPDNDTKLENQPPEIQEMYDGVQDEEYIRIFNTPFPDACVLIKMTKAGADKLIFNDIRAWSIKSTMLPLDKTPVYRWPFFNMYGDARVCIGEIPREYPNVESVASIINYLYIGIGNHDLDHTPYVDPNNKLGIKNSFQLVKYLEENKFTSFPKDLMCRFGTSVIETVENIVANGN